MPVFQIGKDFETSERAGAGDMFQISTVIDQDDNNITNQIDVGIHFRDNEQLIQYLSEVLNIDINEIEDL